MLASKVAIVTGAAHGIGLATVRLMLQQKARVPSSYLVVDGQ